MFDDDVTKTTGTQDSQEAKKKGKGLLVAVLTVVLAAGAAVGFFFIRQSANYLVTDNARVTTTLIAITPPVPGRLERFTAYEGRHVRTNEVLGWVENGEAMRSPVDGLVIHSVAVQNQVVSPMEPLAVIADVNNLHIIANIEETDISRLRPGQSVSVTIDPFGGRQFTGYVAEIGQVTAAELTGNAMFFNTGGTFTRVTHLIPVRVNIVDDVNLDSFIGVNARVRISLRQPTEGLTTVARNSPPVRLVENFNGVSARGTVESVHRRNVYSTLGFMVDRVYVEAGDRVANGQVLGVLDTEDLRIQLLNAEATLRMAEIGVATAEHNYGTVRTLYGTGAIPRNDLIQSEFAFQAATAARQQAQALVDSTRVALERSVLRSPINGTVTAVIAREGSVGMGLMFVVEDTDNLRVMTSFREYDLGRLATGMEVSITPIAAGSAEYAGVISRINPAAMAHSPVVEFETEVLVTSVDTSLRIGMNARLNVAVD